MASFGLSLPKGSLALEALKSSGDPMQAYPYRGWEDLYRDRWKWDKVMPASHSVNCTGACRFRVYVRDGVILREEQAEFPSLGGDIPDFAPRGCEKGICYSTGYTYGPERIKYPLIRVGERGEGKFRRATWDEALDLIAEKIVDTIQKTGPDTVCLYTPVPAVTNVRFCAGHRFAHLLGAVHFTFYDWYCDFPPGSTLTYGVMTDPCETADWFNARYIIVQGARLTDTRIPDAHFYIEARYNGTKVVVVSPDYNQTAIHADQWVPITPGTDAALNLAMAHVIVREGLYDAAHLKEQTDLPFLVREDTKKFLRESDLVAGGSPEKFYAWCQNSTRPVLMPGTWGDKPPRELPVPLFFARNTLGYEPGTLALKGMDPALEGSFEVRLKDGTAVKVMPVFELVKRKLAEITPAKAAAITGITDSVIEGIAREYAETARKTGGRVLIINGCGANHWFHMLENNRSQMLLAALVGSMGKSGGGWTHYVGQWKTITLPGVAAVAFPKGLPNSRGVNTTMWLYKHTGMRDRIEGDELRRHGYTRTIPQYMEESIGKGWMPMYPAKGDPKVLIVYNANFLGQAKGQDAILENLWPKLDLVVSMDIRMSTNALYSDIILPAAGHYEKHDILSTPEHTFIQCLTPAVAPLYESKTEWETFRLLAKKVEEVAKKKGFTKYFDEQFNWERDLSTLYDQQTNGGKFLTEKSVVDFILDASPATKDVKFEDIVARPQRHKVNWTSPMQEGVPYSGFKFFVDQKKPWPTLTGRQQFYCDHDWFLEVGEELPVYKPPVEADKYPLRYNTSHFRHLMHSTWSDHTQILRLTRGGPCILMNPDDASERGLKDNDWAETFNDYGRLISRVKFYPSTPKGFVLMHFGFERFVDALQGNPKIKKGSSFQSPIPIRINPLLLVGKYYQLTFKLNYWGATGVQRDTRVEVKRYTGPVS
jgi:complex iron-sulfur molybdoenzyme family reductase subunit alpha